MRIGVVKKPEQQRGRLSHSPQNTMQVVTVPQVIKEGDVLWQSTDEKIYSSNPDTIEGETDGRSRKFGNRGYFNHYKYSPKTKTR